MIDMDIIKVLHLITSSELIWNIFRWCLETSTTVAISFLCWSVPDGVYNYFSKCFRPRHSWWLIPSLYFSCMLMTRSMFPYVTSRIGTRLFLWFLDISPFYLFYGGFLKKLHPTHYSTRFQPWQLLFMNLFWPLIRGSEGWN